MLFEILRVLQNQRAGDHRATRLKMDLKRWDEEKEELQMKSEHRRVWEPFQFHEMMTSRESMARSLTKGMTPEQEAAFREFLRMEPRRRPPENGNTSPPCAAPPEPSIRLNPSQSD